MNIIRTKAVELETVPAIAYKQKLAAGGAGIKIHRLDSDAVAVFTLDKRSAGAIPYGKIDVKLFPAAAVAEAVDATVGLPYTAHARIVFNRASSDASKQAVNVAPAAAKQDEIPQTAVFVGQVEPCDVECKKSDMVNSKEYKAILKEYTRLDGKLDYKRLNKEFIQFAEKSKTVAKGIKNGVSVEDLLMAVIQNRAAKLAGEKEELSAAKTKALIEALDEIDPKSAFKELNLHLRKMLNKR